MLFLKKHVLLLLIAGVAVLMLAIVITGNLLSTDPVTKVDDWQYDPHVVETSSRTLSAPGLGVSADSSQLGFAAGGAQDINNFRQNIENDKLPLPTDITYEGLFHQYYFDTGKQERCQKLFCPSYSKAMSPDPFSGEREYFLSVGLNSGLEQSEFERKKLNLVIVLDISGSMSSGFNRYYYDQQRTGTSSAEEDQEDLSKIRAATRSINALTEHLADDDRFGMVLFNNTSYKAKPMRSVAETDMESIRGHISEIKANGGTNLAAGMRTATEMLERYTESDSEEYENRIIYLTDAMPNTGTVGEDGLLGMTEGNAENGIFTTFIGMGIDFNTELVNEITKIRGANYYAVRTPSEFKERMDDNFQYMVTPLVYDLKLSLDAAGYEIMDVYGSPEADAATGEVMYVNTLFPSPVKDGRTKGGVVLLHLRPIDEGAQAQPLDLTVSYEDRSGQTHTNSQQVTFSRQQEEYGTSGIRKAILLSRYVNLAKDWLISERSKQKAERPSEPCPIDIHRPLESADGIPVPGSIVSRCPVLGEWERQSMPLRVSPGYTEAFRRFRSHYETEIEVLEDEDLEQEREMLDMLISA